MISRSQLATIVSGVPTAADVFPSPPTARGNGGGAAPQRSPIAVRRAVDPATAKPQVGSACCTTVHFQTAAKGWLRGQAVLNATAVCPVLVSTTLHLQGCPFKPLQPALPSTAATCKPCLTSHTMLVGRTCSRRHQRRRPATRGRMAPWGARTATQRRRMAHIHQPPRAATTTRRRCGGSRTRTRRRRTLLWRTPVPAQSHQVGQVCTFLKTT